MAEPVKTASGCASECRLCLRACDKLIDAGRCLEMGCNYLYAYIDESFSRRFVGCLQKVFSVEIDGEMLAGPVRPGHALWTFKAAREPLPRCPFVVESAYELDGAGFQCTNMRFLDSGQGAFHGTGFRQDLVE